MAGIIKMAAMLVKNAISVTAYETDVFPAISSSESLVTPALHSSCQEANPVSDENDEGECRHRSRSRHHGFYHGKVHFPKVFRFVQRSRNSLV